MICWQDADIVDEVSGPYMPHPATTPTPKFGKPPVVETVIGVQFPELAGFRTSHFGLYGNSLDGYALGEDKARLAEVTERFPPLPVIPQPQFALASSPPLPRVWFAAESGSELIQVQPDRFIFNWRRRETDGSYQEYTTSGPKFLTEFRKFQDFCTNHDLQEPSPNLCEVTYLNHVIPGEGESAIELFGKLFTGLSWKSNNGQPQIPENATFNRVYVIERDKKSVGRLYAEATIAFQQGDNQNQGFVLLKMTGRVIPEIGGQDRLEHSIQIAHDEVVFGFANITNRQIQDNRWERNQ